MNLTSIKTIKDLFARHGFAFTKSLGQNFLINPAIAPRMIPVGNAAPGVPICNGVPRATRPTFALEIGAGIGVLTKELAKVCEKVVCIEIDEGLKPILAETLADYSNVKIIWGDVLKLDLKKIFVENFGESVENVMQKDVVCCANLPYYITSPVIMRLLEERLPLKSITVMVQKEAAIRLCALPGTRECGAVSAAVRYYSEPRKLFDVSRGSFMPTPNVDSAVIRLDVRDVGAIINRPQNSDTGADNRPQNSDTGADNRPQNSDTRAINNRPYMQIEDEKLFFRIVRAAFSQRRKQLANPLSTAFGLQKEAVKNALVSIGLKPTVRAEELTMEGFAGLYKELRKIL
jgi:16S rRNA (adenine1518-N6/adenine1519-N6)-dimethyltransferase